MSSKPPSHPDTNELEQLHARDVEIAPGEPAVELTAPFVSELIGSQGGGTISRTPWQILWIKLRRNRAAMVSLYVLVVLYVMAVFAGFFAPYAYDSANQDLNFVAPMAGGIHLRDTSGAWHRPFVYGLKEVDPATKTYVEATSERYPIELFVRGDGYYLLWLVPSNIHLFGVKEPGHFFLLGSDNFGRDVLSRIIYGSRISLSVGIIGILISTSLGMLIGGISGYFGGKIDFVLMRVVELILALPSLYLILVLRQTFGGGLTSIQIYLIIIVILSFIGWAAEARVIRGMVLSLKEHEYIVAAQALGFSRIWIVVKHILPNTLSFVIVTATLSVPFFILGEVVLSFLGVGIQEPEASWGNMLQGAAQNLRYMTDFPWVLAPGFFIFVAVMAWNVFGDGLRDAADPRTQR